MPKKVIALNHETLRRLPLEIKPNSAATVALPFTPASTAHTLKRILEMSESKVHILYEDLLKTFSDRHKNIENIFMTNFTKTANNTNINLKNLSNIKKLYIGAIFTMEYAVEAAALFNPSIVIHPDQSNLAEGDQRVVISFRAVGEGHKSSISFKEGIIDSHGNLTVIDNSNIRSLPDKTYPEYNKHNFILKYREMLEESGELPQQVNEFFSQLGDTFTLEELTQKLQPILNSSLNKLTRISFEFIETLALANYSLHYSEPTPLNEQIIFPSGKIDSNGIEDARFTRFVDDNGEISYYGTYTAYNGHAIMPILIETKDFQNYDIHTLNGKEVQNKGMALFPRKINGKYYMLSRQDNENNYIMSSDNVDFWKEKQLLIGPEESWEAIQIGNCGVPIELEEGWLVLTHGVGAMRRYTVGAILLDKNNPEKVIGKLKRPLLEPDTQERNGYVPNVVYSCGSLQITADGRRQLFLPYAASDQYSKFATVSIDELLAKMEKR